MLKTLLQNSLPTRFDAIIVASMGRSGSTLVYRAICEGLAAARFGKLKDFGRKLIPDAAWDLSNRRFAPGVVYKTHALANELPRGCKARVVFLFGSATDAALSVLSCRDRYGPEWIAKHFAHMRANGGCNELSERDVLRFEEQIEGWLGENEVRVLGLRYQRLWDNIDALSDFVGFPVSLPEKHARASREKAYPTTLQRFTRTYGPLDEKIAKLPDVVLKAN